MPSHLGQKVRIIKATNKQTGKSYYVMVGWKTGYRDVWINGQHLYYNYTQSYNDASEIDVNQVIQDYNDQESAKKTIVIRRR